jgi:DNA (cytosine-5)-methyltransferase 1
MTAYYNEHEPFAAEWLRELIKAGHIAPGDVDERSIEDVTPDDLRPYDQCHFFAGIGGWSYALRLAGWPDDKPVWTGSCPCQPFSSAGKGGGFDDKRHLWPAFFWLIQQSRPNTIFGEQVASKDGLGWLDLVHADMEGEDYAISALDLCAAGIGAPHIRQRLFWVANSNDPEWGKDFVSGCHNLREEKEWNKGTNRAGKCGSANSLANATSQELQPPWRSRGRGEEPANGGVVTPTAPPLENANSLQPQQLAGERPRPRKAKSGGTRYQPSGRSALSGFWANAEWLMCRDEKNRPTKPGIFPLAHGVPNRVGTLRGAGNAIVPQVAAELITAFLKTTR